MPFVCICNLQDQRALQSAHKLDPASRLPDGWSDNVAPQDRHWIGKALFASKGKLVQSLTNWWFPPAAPVSSSLPVPGPYFVRRLFLWAPSLMWLVDLRCPRCPQKSLTSKGLYNRVRLVLDMTSYYYLAAQYQECPGCKGTFIAYDSRLLRQLPDGIRARFPAVLTHKYACDQGVVAMLRSRTLGNSPSALQNNMQVCAANIDLCLFLQNYCHSSSCLQSCSR